MLGFVHVAERHLVRAPIAFGFQAVNLFRAGPAFRADQHDHRPARPFRCALQPRAGLNRMDFVQRLIERGRHSQMHLFGLVAFDKNGGVAVADQQAFQLGARNARQHGRVGDLVAVQMQDRQHCAIARRIEKLVGMPGGCQRPGFRFAVAHHAAGDQVRRVEHRAKSVQQRITQLAAFVDRTRRFRRNVAGNAAGKGKLPEQAAHAFGVLRDIAIDLAVTAFQIGIGDQRRAAVAGAGDVDQVQVLLFDDPVEMRVNEVQARRGAPVAEQARLDVAPQQRFAQQRVVEQINLAHREVIGGAPVGVDALACLRIQYCGIQGHVFLQTFTTGVMANTMAAAQATRRRTVQRRF